MSNILTNDIGSMLLNKIFGGFKDPLINMIVNNYKSITVQNIGEISQIASASPTDFNATMFNLAKNINETVIIPIALIIITFIAIHEMITMIVDKNNMHEVEAFMFFKWIIKTYILIYLVSNSFNFIMAIFSVSQNMIANANTTANATLEMSGYIEQMRNSLKEFDLINLVFLSLESFILSLGNRIIQLICWIICVGRMLEIYFTISVSSLPFATLTSHRYSSTGDNYIKNAIALGLQGLFMVLAVAFYGSYVSTLAANFNPTDVSFMSLKIIGTGILLITILNRTKSIAKAIVGV